MKYINTRRTILSALFVAAATLAVLPSTVVAFDQNSASAVNVGANQVAVRGFDVVAYFTLGSPTPGKAEMSATHEGATYWFANEVHRDAFKGNPEKYAPQFGGYCAMGAGLNKKLDGDPSAWKIVDNKLYLNLNADVQKKWSQDIAGNLSKANSAWPGIITKAPKDL